MKSNHRLCFLVSSLAISLCLSGYQVKGEDSKLWLAAAGSVSITPDEPVWMAGYASRNKPSEGKVHDLFAKVLILEDEQRTRLAIVSLDLIGVTPELRSQVELAASAAGIQPECLVLNASHTHCGPELRGDRLVRFDIDPMYAALSRKYVQDTASKIGELIHATSANAQPVECFYTHARAGFAMNRRLLEKASFANSPNPDGPIDHNVPVLKLIRQDKSLMAVLFGYACHNTTLSFNLLCGDYAGFAQEYLQASHPNTIAMFINGCSGDQNPYPRRTLELAQQHGRALANAVETALEVKRVHGISGDIRCALENVELQFAPPPTIDKVKSSLKSSNRFERFHAKAMMEQLEQFGKIPDVYGAFPIQVVQIGDGFTFVALCGETVVDYSIRLKKELSNQPDTIVWIAGYSNHVFGYLPSLRVLKEGGYEGGGAMLYTTFPGPFDESVEERVVGKVHELAKRVRAR
jgi:neutral ceramidase